MSHSRYPLYINSCRYGEAEKDCSLALALDDSYIKAYYRRATARVKLGRLEDAKLGTLNDMPTYNWCYGAIFLLLTIRLRVHSEAGTRKQAGKDRAGRGKDRHIWTSYIVAF